MPDAEKKSPPFSLTLPVAIVFAAIVIAGAIILTRGQGPAAVNAAANPAGNQAAISIRPVAANDHMLGSADAKVFIIEYSDFECPFCALVYPSLKKIVADSNGQVAWVYRNLPLDTIHPEARPAAESGECISAELGNDAYWKFVDAVFTDQKSIGTAFYEKVAAGLGANPTTFAQCVASQQYDSRINADATEATDNGAQGTPYIVVMGKKGAPIVIPGALPYAQIQAAVQKVLNEQ